jgi:hypothetical protein
VLGLGIIAVYLISDLLEKVFGRIVEC